MVVIDPHLVVGTRNPDEFMVYENNPLDPKTDAKESVEINISDKRVGPYQQFNITINF